MKEVPNERTETFEQLAPERAGPTLVEPPLQAATPSPTGFAVGLYLEHLEEASFLYEQRRDALLDDPELAWTDLDEFEERLEAHLDGLVLGEDLALAVCRQQVVDGDAGELHAIVRVYCRHERQDLLDEVLDVQDAQDGERVQAVRDALRDELPPAWESDVAAMLGHADDWRQQMAAEIIGYRRIHVPDAVMAALLQAGPDLVPVLIWSLGRLRAEPARRMLFSTYLRHNEEAVRKAAAVALLRTGEQAVLQHLLTEERERPWALRLVGVCGTQRDRQSLTTIAQDSKLAAAALLGLGLLGDPEAVDALLYHLEEPSAAEAAALGLYLITGAELLEEAFVPEEVDEDELFEDELEQLGQGEPLTRPNGEPIGTMISRLSQDTQVWRAWWKENIHTFTHGVRYRTGRAASPSVLVENLRSELLPRDIRQLAYEELVIRYGIDAPFETEQWVRRQQRGIAELEAQATSHSRTGREGRWYLGGRPSR